MANTPIKAASLATLLMALCLLPQILGGGDKSFQDPDDFTQLAIAKETWIQNSWWQKTTSVDAPLHPRPDHWSQIPRLWLVAGATLLQKVNALSPKEALETWGYWANVPLLLLGSALLGIALRTGKETSPWTPALCAAFVLNLPTTRWATNLGHPDHHTWIILAAALFGACLLTQKTKTAGAALGTLHALSPLTFLPIAAPLCIWHLVNPTPETRKTLLWTGSIALCLWLLEYWKNPNFTQLAAPTPWVPLLILATSQIQNFPPKALQEKAPWLFTLLGGSCLALLGLLNPNTFFTPLSPEWRDHSQSEGIYGATPWLDPIYLLPIVPFLVFLLTNRRKTLSPGPAATAITTVTSLGAATLALRAHEGASSLGAIWITKLPEKTLQRGIPFLLIVFAIIGATLPKNKTLQELQELAHHIPQGSVVATHPTYNVALATLAYSQTPTSHHWENWPHNRFFYQILEETNPEIFLQKLHTAKIQYFVAGTILNNHPPKESLANKLAKPPKNLPQLKPVAKTKNLVLYRVDLPPHEKP